ncbi:DUF4351 domain-containing protein [Candidatus Woesearchaeota archaeon]|nr:DUF4351 domain-containing protein [Candidatus Woesearchaeota archaeon]
MALKNGFRKFANVSEIKNDAVLLRDNTLIAVLEVSPIDFDRMPETKKKAVMKKYREWIESLSYPVQVVVRNVNIDIESRAKILKNKIEHLIKQKIEYMDLLKLFKEFEAWFDKYISANKSERRIYYLIVPYIGINKSSLFDKVRKAKAKEKQDLVITLLNKRVDECARKLEETGVRTYRLTTKQLENLYESYFMINIQKGANNESVYIGPDEWFKVWKNVMGKKES